MANEAAGAAAPARGLIANFAEVALLWAPPAAFLLAYSTFGARYEDALSHLSLVVPLLICYTSARLLGEYCSPTVRVVWRYGCAFVLTLYVLAATAYYLAAYIGLQSWGRVVTWRLIETYAAQSDALMDVLGVGAGLAIAAAVASVVTAHALCVVAVHGATWTNGIRRRIRGRVVVVAFPALVALTALQFGKFALLHDTSDGEPFKLTFFPEEVGTRLQSFNTAGSKRLDELEREAKRAYRPLANPPTRDVYLIVGDALRWNHMSVYGYARDTTPFLRELVAAHKSYIATHAYSTCSESSCGLLAMIRSKFVHQLSTVSFSLVDVLRMHGYQAHFILGGDHTNFYGLRDAYGEVDSYYDGASAVGYYMNDDDFVVKRAEEVVQAQAPPLFVQFHLMSTHGLGRKKAEFQRWTPVDNYYRTAGRAKVRESASSAATTNFYDNGVLQFDDYVRRILDVIKTRGRLDRAVVVIVADHGEMLGEHGLFGHAKGLAEEAVRVPILVIDFAGDVGASQQVDRVANLVDVAPTIASVLGVPIPSTWMGMPLSSAARADERLMWLQQGTAVGVVSSTPSATWKLVYEAATARESVEHLDGDATPPARAQLAAWRAFMAPALTAVTDNRDE
ncbi:MAG: sulfatase-like hydrolase/transferase [Lysobacterales bacterium]